MEIWDDATALTAAIRDKRVSSAELLDALLARVDEHNPAINAVVARDVDRAREQARAADAATAAGESWGPLHGLPMTIKDSIETEGLTTTSGAPELRDHVPARDASAVARLKAAGAIVFGKTNLPLYAGDLQSYNDVYGTTNNPWDLGRTPGGSSGGAVAALATGMTPLELGSDIGGSIRIPASFTGVAGIKPSYGVVPVRGHIPGPPGTLGRPDIATLGPLARSVRDLSLALDVLVGPEDDDARAWSIALPPPRAVGNDLRVRVLLDHDHLFTSSAVRGTLSAAIDRLADSGVKVEAADGTAAELIGEGAAMAMGMIGAVTVAGMPDESFEFLCSMAAAEPTPGEPPLMAALRTMTSRHRRWLHLDEQRHQLRSRWAAWFEDVDALLAPACGVPAFPHQHDGQPTMRTLDVDGQTVPYFQNGWSTAFGLVYLPAACVPAGLTPEGLPVGLQVVAPYLEDNTALAGAALVEERLGGFVPPPAFAGG